MRSRKKITAVTILVILLFTAIPINLFPIIFANGSGGCYGGGQGEGETAAVKNAGIIEYFVIEGAGYYLNAHSEILTYLNRLELSYGRVDAYEWLPILDKALINMENAIAIYQVLIQMAEVTPYNETVIEKLKAFDYHQFMVENGLNESIFKEVESYLKNGDITGVYRRIYTKFQEMKGLLLSIRHDVSLYKIPPLPDNWRLNELCSLTLVLGQYMSYVFYSL